MKVALTEKRGDQEHVRREFDRPIVRIGRDPVTCDLVFDQTTWPMVSRIHAELVLENNRCLLIDKNSTQGTFVNRQRILKPTEIQTGALIQFGQDGPILTMEILSELPLELVNTPTVRPPDREPLVKTAAARLERLDPEFPKLIFESGAPECGTHLVLNSETTVLGRDLIQVKPEGTGGSVVSRRHAEIRRDNNGQFFIEDLKSFNGTLVNGKRISQQTPLHDGDRIQLSVGGPILRFVDSPDLLQNQKAEVPKASAARMSSLSVVDPLSSGDSHGMVNGQSTLVYRARNARLQQRPATDIAREQLLIHCTFEGNQTLSVGRASDNDIQLDGLLISKYHARFIRTAEQLLIEDAGSTNGVYWNGTRVAGRQPVKSDDVVQIGPFVLKADPIIGVKVFDTRSETRIDAVDITEEVPSLWGNGNFRLLDRVSLAIEPNEFVGLLGPSGAGKSTLMNALNGMKRTTGGQVFINNLDLYHHLYSIKQSIGYVPQDDIIHRELTCYNTLYYVARLRLSRDVPAEDIDQIVNEVFEVTGLTDRRDALISQLSGGQRKRVSIAVELITQPSLIFLDEPTSGLDPAAEERIMKLFRQIAESGRTVIMTTHAMENVHLFDKIVLLMRGKLIFCGTPDEALKFAGVTNFIDLYNKLEHPPEVETAPPPKASKAERRAYEKHCNELLEAAAEGWRQRFLITDTYARCVANPLSHLQNRGEMDAAVYRRPGTIDLVRQWATLLARYTRVLASDRLNLLILFIQAPIIAFLTYLVVGKQDSRDFTYFVLALVPVWFGTSVAAREIVKERSIFKRERMVNLALLPYIGSKLFALSCIVSLQCLLLFGTLKVFDLANLMQVPGMAGGLPQFLTMVLTGVVGIALGLFMSVLVKTSEVATSIVPLILIPQILLCGLVGVPQGLSRIVGAAMPATWSFDQMKRLSTLDTLRKEGSDPSGKNEGLGLFNHIEKLNERKVQNARHQLEDYTRRTNESLKEYDRRIKSSIARGDVSSIASAKPPAGPGSPPELPNYEGISDDLQNYVTFKHPWGGVFINPAVLLMMIFVFLAATLTVLRAQDSKATRTK